MLPISPRRKSNGSASSCRRSPGPTGGEIATVAPGLDRSGDPRYVVRAVTSSVEKPSPPGAINLHQSIELLEDVVRVCVNYVFELVEEGRFDPKTIDWWVTHYSSHILREQAYELFVRGGLTIPLDRVFTNLYTRGKAIELDDEVVDVQVVLQEHVVNQVP